MYNATLSTEIFDQLMNGRVINQHMLNNASEPAPNHLFTEIINNKDDYTRQYDMAGHELVINPSYIYLREKGLKGELRTEVSMKASVLLLLIGKYLNDSGMKLSRITDKNFGLTEQDIARIDEMEDTQEILEKASMKGRLTESIRTILVIRNILLERPDSQSYLLSDSGKAFFNEIVSMVEASA